jgi:hypothetical protein
MASFHAIAATSRSLERLLNAAFDADEPIASATTRAVIVRSDDFDLTSVDNVITFPALTIFLYRVTIDSATRAPYAAGAQADGRSHVPLNLHFLLTPWAEDAEFEHLVLGRAIQALADDPVMTGPLLVPSATWADHEVIQVIPDETGLDDLLRTFDALEASFRLSVGYVARVVRLDGQEPDDLQPVHTVIDGLVPSVP